jgi:hypothetical protein
MNGTSIYFNFKFPDLPSHVAQYSLNIKRLVRCPVLQVAKVFLVSILHGEMCV